MADPLIEKFLLENLDGGDSEVFIWGRPEKLATYFKANSLTPVDALDPAMLPQSVKAYSRRQYPGDPTPVSRKSGLRRRAIAGDFKRVALPGRPFWCEHVASAPGVTPKDYVVRQFVIQGSFTQLRVYAQIWAARSFVLRSPGGRAWDIELLPPKP